MGWRDRVPACFGDEDLIFASNPMDEERAEKAEKTVRDIRRATRRHHSAEEKIRIVLEGLRGEDSSVVHSRYLTIWRKMLWRCSRTGERDACIMMPLARRIGSSDKTNACFRCLKATPAGFPLPPGTPGKETQFYHCVNWGIGPCGLSCMSR